MAKHSLYVEDFVRANDPARAGVRGDGPTIACAAAQNGYGQASFFNAAFTTLLFIASAVIVLSVSLIILGAVDFTKSTSNDQTQFWKAAFEAGIGVIGTAASGTALAFVVSRRGEIKAEQVAALALVKEYCGDQTADGMKA